MTSPIPQGKGSEVDKTVDPKAPEPKAGEPDKQWPASGKWENPFEYKGPANVRTGPPPSVKEEHKTESKK